MKLKFIFGIIFLICTFCVNANVTFKAQKPGTVVEGDIFQITFSLINGDATNFKGPKIEGCKLMSDKGVSKMSSYQNINGVASASTRIDYTCTYRAIKSGKVEVPSVSVTVNGKQYKSQAFTFTISKNSGTPNQRIQKSIFDEEYSTRRPNAISENELFVRIILSKQSAYEQEPIECTIKLYTQYGIRSFIPTTQPSFDGFIIEEIPLNNIQSQEETYNGKTYNTAILKKCIIFPQKSGSLTINSGKYDLTAYKYEQVSIGQSVAFNRIPIPEKLSITSNSVTLNILPLPQPQPKGFSGAVGQFEINTDLRPSSFRTNESGTFVYKISGTGNVKYIKEPDISFPLEFELYTPKNNSDTDVSTGTMIGSITFDYTFVPQNVGKFKIPEHSFIYFDPMAKKYVTLKSKSYEVSVAKGLSVAQQEIKAKNTDIRHIKLGDKDLSLKTTYVAYTIWYWMLYFIILTCFIIFVIQYKKHLKLNSDIVGLKLAKANKVARKRLKLANQYINTGKSKEFYEEIVNALWGYLSDKLSIPTSQLLRDNILQELTIFGANEQLCHDVIDILDNCDMALYSPQLSDKEISKIYNKTMTIINDIEAIKRQK